MIKNKKSSNFVKKLFKLVETLTKLLISSLSIYAFKAVNLRLAVKLDLLTPVASFIFFNRVNDSNRSVSLILY